MSDKFLHFPSCCEFSRIFLAQWTYICIFLKRWHTFVAPHKENLGAALNEEGQITFDGCRASYEKVDYLNCYLFLMLNFASLRALYFSYILKDTHVSWMRPVITDKQVGLKIFTWYGIFFVNGKKTYKVINS